MIGKPATPELESSDQSTTTYLDVRGVDISSLPKVEDHGGVFYNDAGQPQDIFQILADHGINYVRLKLWHTPASGYNNLERVKAMAQRIKAADMGFLLNIHYSDAWADPGKQYKPAAWRNLDYDQLKAAVYSYTKETITELKRQGTEPDIVQIGNEIPSGMLWNTGELDGSSDQFARLAGLLKAGIAGVKDSGSSAKIMLHLDRGGNNGLYRWWFDGVIAEGVEFDVIGLSFYGYWHGELADLSDNLNDLAYRYNKELFIVETAYPYTLQDQDGFGNLVGQDDELVAGYPPTVAGQTAWLRDLMQVVADTPEGLGKGVFYWEPAWLGLPGCGWDPNNPASGNEWENQALFDFDGRALSSWDVFLEFSGTAPDSPR
ncbi:MAG: arabinogalactan endo-1,4-beta-galactosidase [Anaerolineae bacterium]|nr:arabinogalactan endo-1,4-beta-galactosidase [Anaerolineae bacterium]